MTGPLEKTTEAYSVAKLAGIKLCQYLQEQYGDRFISVLPCNLFGERDNFNEVTAHCLPGLLARMHRANTEGAPTFSVWGNGEQKREFLFAPDLAQALMLIMEEYEAPEPINAGSGFELTIRALSEAIAGVVGYTGELVFDESKPTGTPRKVLDSSKLRALGWAPQTPFYEALVRTYQWYVDNKYIPGSP